MPISLGGVNVPSNSNQGDVLEFLGQLSAAIEVYVQSVAFEGALPSGIALTPDPDNAGLYLLS